jgi:uncharacterized membrane protein YdjX (TVP38/TMEM64 family)
MIAPLQVTAGRADQERISSRLHPSRPSRAVGAGVIAALIAFAALIALVPELREIAHDVGRADPRGLRADLVDLGATGVVVLAAFVLVHAVVPFPAEIPTAAAGFAYGFAAALPLMLACWLVSALCAYALAHTYGRPLARRVVGAERLASGERLVARGGVRALLLVRLMPLIPFNLVCYASGLARVPLRRYAWTTLVGMAPAMAAVAWLGARLREPRLSDWQLWAPIAALCGLVLAECVLRRRLRSA